MRIFWIVLIATYLIVFADTLHAQVANKKPLSFIQALSFWLAITVVMMNLIEKLL